MSSALETLIDNARHNEVVLSKLQAIEMRLIAVADFASLLDTLLLALPEAFGLEDVALFLLDPHQDTQTLLTALAVPIEQWHGLHFSTQEATWLPCFTTPPSPLLRALPEDPLHALFGEAEVASVALLPLSRHAGLIGCLALGSRDATRFTADLSTEFLARLAAIAGVCIENVINSERLKYIGLTDPLTGIHNRRYFDLRLADEVNRIQRYGGYIACLFIDIDHFKNINDTWGHPIGDVVLKAVAGRIKNMLRLTDTLARYGGEEFVVLLEQADAAQAFVVAERIREAVRQPAIPLDNGALIPITVSIGISSFVPRPQDDGAAVSAQRLLHEADTALYRAKTTGRNRVVAFTTEAAADPAASPSPEATS